jgi:hypothetical protein
MIEFTDGQFTGKYLLFQDKGPVSPGAKTRRFIVNSVKDFSFLGDIIWFVRWKCYVFIPISSSIFNSTCLNELAVFCKDVTDKHMQPFIEKGREKAKKTRRKNKLERLTKAKQDVIMVSENKEMPQIKMVRGLDVGY